MKELIGLILAIVGVGAAGLATITAIGFGLYDWAHAVPLPMAAWTAFLLWIKMVFGGLATAFVGLVLKG